ncbi:beta-glucosidase family protein [Kushneria sinocarnis]|uniref:beta-glucosidase family protein n=1 Tax=Kushneria sinocarnis TaxID=595502 RepID=UPI000EB075FF|nr:glycoside hydrolase family 3 C-terminal domain-containing protein [Kushneria sinocarnis]
MTGALLSLPLHAEPLKSAPPPEQAPWLDPELSPDRRAELVMARMTPAEKQLLLYGTFAGPEGQSPHPAPPRPQQAVGSAGYVPGVPRLGIPAQQQTDAGLGVTNPGMIDPDRRATALPSVLASGATWQPALSRQGGAMIAREARHYGFNVLLAGNAGIIREPRAGRNFEMPSEDPLLSGLMAGARINGIQSEHVMSTLKHYALNAQETGRFRLDARIGRQALRESDLLAFRTALEVSDPGAAMCAYNSVNGEHACASDYLLHRVLKDDWQFPGFVMSDWGAVHSAASAANAGLDQQSAGQGFDGTLYFKQPLWQALDRGKVPHARINDMAFRILRSYFATGLVDDPVRRQDEPIKPEADSRVAQKIEQNAIVLLKNADHVLPLDPDSRQHIAVIGGRADRGVLAGGGSSAVIPWGGDAAPGLVPPRGVYTQRILDPSPPLEAMRRQAPKAGISFTPGDRIDQAVAAARHSDVAVVFAGQWTAETLDMKDLLLPGRQNELIRAVARANPRTVVVLETGGPVKMPWRDRVAGILEAWYPGQRGGEAIGQVLFGAINPAGRLPVTFPRDSRQLPHPQLPGRHVGNDQAFRVDYHRAGAAVGYRWFARENRTPLYPFGHGLSYTRFAFEDLALSRHDRGVQASFRVTNTGKRTGRTVPQLYVHAPDGSPLRLGGWRSVELEPGESRRVSIDIPPRQLARFHPGDRHWHIPAGHYRVALARSATRPVTSEDIELAAATLPP